jgi:hypothetical protein
MWSKEDMSSNVQVEEHTQLFTFNQRLEVSLLDELLTHRRELLWRLKQMSWHVSSAELSWSWSKTPQWPKLTLNVISQWHGIPEWKIKTRAYQTKLE